MTTTNPGEPLCQVEGADTSPSHDIFVRNLRDQAVEDVKKLVGSWADPKRIEAIVEGYCSNGQLHSHAFIALQKIISRLRDLKVALIVVDYQNDFITGSLAIGDGPANEDPLSALPLINHLLAQPGFQLVVYTLDWHPSDHISFVCQAKNSDRELDTKDKDRDLNNFETVHFVNPAAEQTLYPSHCVAGTWGAEIHPDLRIIDGARIVRKGQETMFDSYSAFTNNVRSGSTELDDILRAEGVDVVLGCGLAYDICVKHTLQDAADLGFLTGIITDCSKGLDRADMEAADALFREKNIANLTAEDVETFINVGIVPIEWVEEMIKRTH